MTKDILFIVLLDGTPTRVIKLLVLIIMSCSNKPEVLLLVANDKIGGVARPVINLAHEFRKRGFGARIAFPGTENFLQLREWCCQQGIDPEAAPAGLEENTPGSRQIMRETIQFIRRDRPYVVSLHYGSNYIALQDVLAVRLAGCRCIAGIYSPFPVSILSKRQKTLTRLAARLCERITFLSEWSRQDYLKIGLRRAKTEVLPPALHPPDRLPTQADARVALNLPPNAYIISVHARLVPEKGVADMIEAAAIMKLPMTQLRLLIAGYGPERESLERLAALRLEPGQAQFLGHLADPTDLYAAADVFALATQAESFGIVFVEAAFHGVPSIGTTVNAVPEVVRDGQTGLLVSPRDPNAMAQALLQLHDDLPLRRRLGDAARARAHKEYSESVIVDRYRTLLASGN